LKNFLLFFIIITCNLSCKKDGANSVSNTAPVLTPGEIAATGELIYSCICVDGPGLIYGTDDHQTLVFENYDTLVMDSIMTEYKDLLNVHSRLIYTNTGDGRCMGNANPCIMVPIVKIVSLTKL
jgi:hypothetical protein